MKKRRKKNHNEWPGKTSGNPNKEVLQVNTYGLEFLKPIYFKPGSAFILIQKMYRYSLLVLLLFLNKCKCWYIKISKYVTHEWV